MSKAERARVDAAPNPYAVLGLPPVFTEAQLKTAHRRLAGLLHPDRNPDDAEAAHLMSKVNLAVTVLTDVAQRRRLDMVLHTDKLACKACKGTGVGWAAKGFAKKQTACKYCSPTAGPGWGPLPEDK